MGVVEDTVERYPQLAGIIDHPELGPILQQAAENGWGADELFGAIYDTRFYQSQWSTFRQLEILRHQDPAEYQNRYRAAEVEMSNLMSQLGIDPEARRGVLDRMTTAYLNNGQDEWVVFDQLKRLIRKNPGIVGDGGTLASRQRRYQELAGDYMLRLSDNVARTHAVNVWAREDTEEALENRFRMEAIRRFGHLEDELKRGLTVRQAIDPQIQAVASTLETDPDQIDLFDGRWQQIWDYRDPDSGKSRTMTASEATRFARRQKEFKTTKAARDEAASMALNLTRSMGEVAL